MSAKEWGVNVLRDGTFCFSIHYSSPCVWVLYEEFFITWKEGYAKTRDGLNIYA
jgi:hypothetical protein